MLVAVGLCLFVVMGLVERREHAMRAGAVRTTGTVVALLPHRSEGSTVFVPLVRFKTATGAELDFTASDAARSSSRKIGDIVPVIYSKLNPTGAAIDSWTARWIKTILLGALGLLSVGGGVTWLRARR
ncbi:MAG: DUF3592 domain-containing protein [Vicinamibacterales bacterium]